MENTYSSASFTDHLTTEASCPDPDIEIMSKNPSNIAKYQNTPLAAWILVLLLLLHILQKNSTDNVVYEIFQLYLRQVCINKKRTNPYSRTIMIFCLTIASYSTRAYNFLREVAHNCLPTVGTLLTYRRRVDGSPGFSVSALNMLRNKVKEMLTKSKKLFISLSCDDMSIRQHVWFTGTTFYGYEDLGEGPGLKPAKHVMMIMATALNMRWKLPVGYFLLPDSFTGDKRAALIRNCIYHVNNTGAVITSLVMDNCPVNYATFRR